jgi:Tol biopolymer transport system component/tRNA A-37 threonylcarbamoyl transferase component Bud32
MGEVFRARDTKLGRDVAIKVLPAAFAQDPERLARFEREARVLASLNHTNIAHVYGFESATLPDSSVAHFLAMEMVEGEDLAERLKRGAIPIDEAIAIAKQIAEGLEEAHEHGIIHRDLKPANVKVTPDGRVKILDFGLAKALEGDPASSAANSHLSHSPTMSRHMTEAGMIMGTAAYMSPEQARGKGVDKRADIWSFGVVLFEMLAGKRLFEGETISDVLAAVLTRDPDWPALPSNVSAPTRRLVARCLERDPRRRLRDIGEARLWLDGFGRATATDDTTPATTRAAERTRLVPWGIALVAVAVVAFQASRHGEADGPRPLLRTELALPQDVEFFGGPTSSADGSRVAFVGVGEGVRSLYVRNLSEPDFRRVPGTETAVNGWLSEDGRRIAVVTNDTKVKVVDLETGVIDTLATGGSIYSAPAWMKDGSVVFSRGTAIVRRRPSGDETVIATANVAGGEFLLSWPVLIGDESGIIFVGRRSSEHSIRTRLEWSSIDGAGRRLVAEDVTQVILASRDRIVFVRDGAMFAAGLSKSGDTIAGVPVRLSDSASISPLGGVAATVSAKGALFTAPPSIVSGRLVLISMNGNGRPVGSVERGFLNPRLSPDGRLIAFSDAGVVWTYDPGRGTVARVTTESEPTIGFPMWAKDGRSLYIRSPTGIRIQRADGEGAPKTLPNTNETDYPSTLSADGSTLYFLRLSAATGGDIYATPAQGGEVKPFLATPAYEGGPQVSPDGRWLLYVSNESGRMQVYVRPLSGADRKWAVSSADSIQAIWSRDGGQIFYRSGQKLLAVSVSVAGSGPDAELRLGAPRELFERRQAYGQNLTIPNYSLSVDGKEFLMVESDGRGRYLTMVLNWLDHLPQ